MSANQQAVEARRMAVYAAMIDRVDQKVGELVAKLEKLGELDNTLILFAADNLFSGEVPELKMHKAGQRAGDGFFRDHGPN